MVRVKRGKNAYIRRKAILKLSSGFKGAHSRLFSASATQIMKSLMYSYIGRKTRKATVRKLWISRLSQSTYTSASQTRLTGSYSILRKSFNDNLFSINLKSLQQMKIIDPQSLAYLFERAK